MESSAERYGYVIVTRITATGNEHRGKIYYDYHECLLMCQGLNARYSGVVWHRPSLGKEPHARPPQPLGEKETIQS